MIQLDPVSFVTCAQCRAELDTEGLPPFSTIICPQCGVEAVVHATLGHFALTRLLGSGGMGAVYEARDGVLNRAVAVKVMHKSLGEDPVFVENFLREAQAAARLNHPDVVQVYSHGQENGMPYIVMELVTGGSFDKVIEGRGGKVDAALALRVGMEVAEGLRHAADNGLVHGDIKPENILLDENGLAKIVDFGIASLSAKAGGKEGEVWGTPYYIAPEKVRRQKADFRSDMYSLGATLFHAIAGIPPFEGKDSAAVVKARLAKPAPNLAAVLTSVDPEAAAIVDRMLQADPQLRHPTYESLIGDMRRYLDKAAPKSTLSKRVVIKGKTATGNQAGTSEIQPVTGPVAAADPAPGAPKKKGLVLQRGIRMAAVASAAAPRPAIPEAPDAPKKKANGLLIGLVAGGVAFVLLLAAAGFAFWYIPHKNKEKERLAAEKAERELAEAAQTLRDAAKEAVDLNTQTLAIHTAATNTLQRLHDLADEAFGDAFKDALGPAHNLANAAPAPKVEKPAADGGEDAPADEAAETPKDGDEPGADAGTFSFSFNTAPSASVPGDTLGIVSRILNLHNDLAVIQNGLAKTTRLAKDANEKRDDLETLLAPRHIEAGEPVKSAPPNPAAFTNDAHAITLRVKEIRADTTLGPKALAAAGKRIGDGAPDIVNDCNRVIKNKQAVEDAKKQEEDERKAEAERVAATAARLRAIEDEQAVIAGAVETTIEKCGEFDF
ncbi:MAG: protein kinase, partial [Kiritimatiellaeota bacterium]|nr:protein kinase [Kiritimatiellota bacterium]